MQTKLSFLYVFANPKLGCDQKRILNGLVITSLL